MSEKNLDGYGASLIPWRRVRERLEEGFAQAPESGGPGRHTSWLATVRPDGRPHVMPLGVLWLDGALYFCPGPGEERASLLGTKTYYRAMSLVNGGRAVEDDLFAGLRGPAQAQLRVYGAYRPAAA